jgi:hypothetical protein
MQKGFILKLPDEFHAAITLQKNIEVWQQGKIKNYGGPIQMQTDEAVIINDAKYLKNGYEFRVR